MSLEMSGTIAKIARAATKFRKFEISMFVQDGEVFREIIIETTKNGQQTEVRLKEAPGYMQGPNEYVSSLAVAFSKARSFIGDMTPIIKSCTGGDAEVCADIRSVWCDMFKIDPTTVEIMSPEDVAMYRKCTINAMLQSLLEKGGDAVALWNSRPSGEKFDSHIDFTKRDMSGKNLSGIYLERLDFSGSNFEHCNLEKSALGNADFAKTTFKKANLEQANLSSVNAVRADFSAACMKSVISYSGNFKNAIFKKTDLSESSFTECDIRGADFTDSITHGASFNQCKYDEKTILPADFPIEDLKWKGAGVDPRLEQELKEALDKGIGNYDEFIEEVKCNFEFERTEKALKMLKKEKFQLYSHITPEQVVGIVRSQTDSELVYACMLNQSGNFSCCTQNLKPCGGLKGALCKHLLVLVIGLTRSDQLEAGTAANWVIQSKFHQPKMQKELMSDVFLQYKGALVGEFDWRPTETVPEDYYI
ncbi:MAG: pentapeptide repeat-containing protein [Cyanobacteria bacterium SZAS-4]|nr:pentapeptide repeat-containing protein [Cyanobacteria bacterium SZAS-4]